MTTYTDFMESAATGLKRAKEKVERACIMDGCVNNTPLNAIEDDIEKAEADIAEGGKTLNEFISVCKDVLMAIREPTGSPKKLAVSMEKLGPQLFDCLVEMGVLVHSSDCPCGQCIWND